MVEDGSWCREKGSNVRKNLKTLHGVRDDKGECGGKWITWHRHSRVWAGRNLSQKRLDPQFLRSEQQRARKCPLESFTIVNFSLEANNPLVTQSKLFQKGKKKTCITPLEVALETYLDGQSEKLKKRKKKTNTIPQVLWPLRGIINQQN